MQTFIKEINLNFGSILLQITLWVLVGFTHNEQLILKNRRVQTYRTSALEQFRVGVLNFRTSKAFLIEKNLASFDDLN